MSTQLEDRLGAALRARAEQVQPEDLGPVTVPQRGMLSWRPALLGLAAAAAVAAVVLPFATGGGGENRPTPPASSTTPTPVDTVAGAHGDVDGDGRKDFVSIDADGALGLARAGSGSVVEAQQPPGTQLVGLAEIGAPGLAVVLEVEPGDDTGDDSDRDARVLRWQEGGFAEVATHDQAWIGRSEGQTFWVQDLVLYTGSLDPADPTPNQRQVFGHSWSLDGDKLRSTEEGELCWRPRTQEHPVACDGEGFGLDVGPRGDLPAMFPAAQDLVGVGEPVPFALESEDDSFELRGELPEGADTVKPGMVELVVTVGGVEHTAPIPAGWTPRLSVRTVLSRGTPGYLVVQEGGDSSTMTVYSFWNGNLQALGMPSGVPFGRGFSGGEGETRAYRTWISEDGVLFTAEEVDPGAGLHRVFTWSADFGEAMTEQDLGKVCIDWQSSPPAYGRCP